jgi:nitrate reductase cytochrome c-type subunit
VLLALVIAISVALVSCTTAKKPAATPAPSPVVTPAPPPSKTPKAEVKKYIHQVLATGKVGANEYASSPPGQSTILEREYPGAPPLIPHSLAGLTVTKEQNSCLTCHTQGLSFGPGHTATQIPDSHYIDIPTGTRTQDIQAIRYNCQICHIPQSPETPLLEASGSTGG